MSAKRKRLLALAGMAISLGLLTTGALAQTRVGGTIALKLSDPGGASEPWRVAAAFVLGRTMAAPSPAPAAQSKT